MRYFLGKPNNLSPRKFAYFVDTPSPVSEHCMHCVWREGGALPKWDTVSNIVWSDQTAATSFTLLINGLGDKLNLGRLR